MKRKYKAVVRALFLINFVVFFGCSRGSAPTPTATVTPLPTDTPSPPPTPTFNNTVMDDKLPFYIVEVWPSPGSILTLSEYNRSRGRKIYMRGVGVDYTIIPFPDAENSIGKENREMVILLIDGEDVSNEAWEGLLTATSEVVSWSPDLDVGKHVAIFRILIKDGTILDFSWEFTIID